MPLLDFRQPKCVVTKEETSGSGKYRIFLGHHFVQGHTCYDVGAINRETGEIISRHYLDNGKGNPKAEALAVYHEFAKGMLKGPQNEEQEDNNPRLADAFRRALRGGKTTPKPWERN